MFHLRVFREYQTRFLLSLFFAIILTNDFYSNSGELDPCLFHHCVSGVRFGTSPEFLAITIGANASPFPIELLDSDALDSHESETSSSGGDGTRTRVSRE